MNSYSGPKLNQSLHSPNKISNLADTSGVSNYPNSFGETNEALIESANTVLGKTNSGRVINRNYMQIQPNTLNSNALQSNQLVSSIYSSESFKEGNSDDHNRTRSISRSVKNLFKPKSKKRDKSCDVQTVNQYDLNSCNQKFDQK